MTNTNVMERPVESENTNALDEVKAYIDGALAYWNDHKRFTPLDDLQKGVENGLNVAGMALLTGQHRTTEQLSDHFRLLIGHWEDVRKDGEWTDYERGHVLGLTMALKRLEGVVIA